MKRLDRRTLLRGACGITLGLPFLEAMGNSSFSAKPPVRTAFFFIPNGVGPNTIWNPLNEGKDYEVHSSLTPLNPVKHLINVHGGLRGHKGGHPTSASLHLVGRPVAVKDKLKSGGPSIDQLIAKEIGRECYLPSIELSLDRPKGGLDGKGNNLAYGGYLSWGSSQNPIPREMNPHNAFKRLFKDIKSSGSSGNYSKSILDYIKDDANRLKRELGRDDNQKIDQYFHSVREIERRLETIGQSTKKLPTGTNVPEQVIKDRWKRARAMVDVMVLAFQTDRTRVASFMLAHGGSQQSFRFLNGIKENHHSLSHHGGKETRINGIMEINKFLLGFYVKMVKKMSKIQEGNGTLLDNSLIHLGSYIKDGQRHSVHDLPILVAGAGGGSVKTGYYYNHKGKHLNSLLLGIAKTAGCKMNSFAKATEAVI